MPEITKEKLLKDMKRTKGVRFNASRRLERHERTMTRNTAYASVAVIVITLLPAFFNISQFWVSVIAMMTVALSIFILAFTLLHSSNRNILKSDQFHRCALEVNALRRELVAASDDANMLDFARRYDEILGRYNINHEQVDYDKYRIEHPDEFKDIASEDVSSARRNVSTSDGWAERFANIVAGATVAISVAALATASFEGLGLLEAAANYIGELFRASE